MNFETKMKPGEDATVDSLTIIGDCGHELVIEGFDDGDDGLAFIVDGSQVDLTETQAEVLAYALISRLNSNN